MADVEGKKLTELRVIDLKTELERRGLDKSGNKAALLERLSKVNDISVILFFFLFALEHSYSNGVVYRSYRFSNGPVIAYLR